MRPVSTPLGPDLRGQRILVVAINYAPEHTGTAPYTSQACEYMQRQGGEVLVLAGVPHYPQWSVAEPYRRRLRIDEVRREGVHVRRLRHTVPARQSAVKRATYEATFGLHVLTQRLPWTPDVVLAVVPSLLGAMAAARIAHRTGARLAVWVQDLMGPAAAQSGIAGGERVAKLTGQMEGHVLRQADVVVVLNDNFRRYAEQAGVDSDRIVVRPNWTHVEPPRGNRAAIRSRLGWGEDVVILHSGNMGLKQGLENVVEAAKLASTAAPQLRFVLMGEGSQHQDLLRLAEKVPTLQFLPAASTEEFPDFLAAADLLLVNERASAVNMSLPSKLTSYFRAGVPVVAAVPPDGGTAAEIARSGAGVVVPPEDCQALVEAVVALAADGDLRQALRRAARSYAHNKLASAPALAALASAVTGPGPTTSGATQD
jgi:colanic acid biosynthesis glycosyl transferase WcaI